MGMASIYENNCIKCIEAKEYEANLLIFNELERNNSNFYKAYKILVLINLNKISDLNCFLLTLNYEEWKSNEIQFAYQIFNASQEWALEETNNLLKMCKYKEFIHIISSIKQYIENKTNKIEIEEEDKCNEEKRLRNIQKLLEMKKDT